MNKLHELLAVEKDLSERARLATDEAIDTYGHRDKYLMGYVRDTRYFDENRQNENTSEEKVLVTTVGEKLNFVATQIAPHFDCTFSKDSTNLIAVADIIVDGETIAEKVPATFLLGLESKLARLRQLYQSIPTLQPGINWESDESLGKGYMVSKGKVDFKTAKVLRSKILVDPTEHHPAQVDKWNEEERVARVETTVFSGAISPRQKSDMLERLDALIRAVKQARQRANTVGVVRRDIGKKLLSYINGE